MTDTVARKILNYNIPYPICRYSENSRRVQSHDCTKQNIYELLSALDGWNTRSEISIDGVNGSGKSSLAQSTNRIYRKINLINPGITCGSEYNYDPLKSLQYMCLQQLITAPKSIWDRCAYSNLIFYFVHHLMYMFRDDSPIPDDQATVWGIFNTMAIDINLSKIITFMKSIKNIPTLFIVCRNLDLIGLSLKNRKSLNDTWNAKEYNYQKAQYHAYMYFGKILEIPVFDIMDFVEQGYTLGDMQLAIINKINLPPESAPTKDDLNFKNIVVPNIEHSNELSSQIAKLGGDNMLIYEFSNK